MNINDVFSSIKLVEKQIQESLIQRSSYDLYDLRLLDENFVMFDPNRYTLGYYITNKKLKTTIYILELHSKNILGKLNIIDQNRVRIIYQNYRLQYKKLNAEANQEAQNLLVEYITSNQFDDSNTKSNMITQLSDDIRLLEVNKMQMTIARSRFVITKSIIVFNGFCISTFKNFVTLAFIGGGEELCVPRILYILFSFVVGMTAYPNLIIFKIVWGIPLSLFTVISIILGLIDNNQNLKKLNGYYSQKKQYFMNR